MGNNMLFTALINSYILEQYRMFNEEVTQILKEKA